MAKGIYLGIDSLSRKVKKMYVGVNGLARKIKKGYVGVNGLARLFFSGQVVPYVMGATTPMAVNRLEAVAGSIGNNLVILGGAEDDANIADVYDDALTHTSYTPSGTNGTWYAGQEATIPDKYAVFGAWNYSRSGGSSYGTAVSPELVHTRITMQYPRIEAAAAEVGNVALFAGGKGNDDYDDRVEGFSDELTAVTCALLSHGCHNLGGDAIPEYAIFGPGRAGNYYRGETWAYSPDLVQVNGPTVDNSQYCATAHTENHVIIAGGFESSNSWTSDLTTAVCAIDASLTKTTLADLDYETFLNQYMEGVSYLGIALFQDDEIVQAYDTELVKLPSMELARAYRFRALGSVGDYALFAGGKRDNFNELRNEVDVIAS